MASKGHASGLRGLPVRSTLRSGTRVVSESAARVEESVERSILPTLASSLDRGFDADLSGFDTHITYQREEECRKNTLLASRFEKEPQDTHKKQLLIWGSKTVPAAEGSCESLEIQGAPQEFNTGTLICASGEFKSVSRGPQMHVYQETIRDLRSQLREMQKELSRVTLEAAVDKSKLTQNFDRMQSQRDLLASNVATLTRENDAKGELVKALQRQTETLLAEKRELAQASQMKPEDAERTMQELKGTRNKIKELESMPKHEAVEYATLTSYVKRVAPEVLGDLQQQNDQMVDFDEQLSINQGAQLAEIISSAGIQSLATDDCASERPVRHQADEAKRSVDERATETSDSLKTQLDVYQALCVSQQSDISQLQKLLRNLKHRYTTDVNALKVALVAETKKNQVIEKKEEQMNVTANDLSHKPQGKRDISAQGVEEQSSVDYLQQQVERLKSNQQIIASKYHRETLRVTKLKNEAVAIKSELRKQIALVQKLRRSEREATKTNCELLLSIDECKTARLQTEHVLAKRERQLERQAEAIRDFCLTEFRLRSQLTESDIEKRQMLVGLVRRFYGKAAVEEQEMVRKNMLNRIYRGEGEYVVAKATSNLQTLAPPLDLNISPEFDMVQSRETSLVVMESRLSSDEEEPIDSSHKAIGRTQGVPTQQGPSHSSSSGQKALPSTLFSETYGSTAAPEKSSDHDAHV